MDFDRPENVESVSHFCMHDTDLAQKSNYKLGINPFSIFLVICCRNQEEKVSKNVQQTASCISVES